MEESERPAKKVKGDHENHDEAAQFAAHLDEADNSEVTLPSSNSHSASQKPNGEMLPPASLVNSSATNDNDAPPKDQTTTGSSAPIIDAPPPTAIAGETTSETAAKKNTANSDDQAADASKPLSKSALKKLKRKQEWEDGREARKAIKREKRKVKQAKKREAFEEAQAAAATTAATAEGDSTITSVNGDPTDPATIIPKPEPPPKRPKPILLPITFVFDCAFDKYMMDKEIMSITSQITRCYSDNRHAPYRAHLAVSSFSGRMRHRLETVLAGHFKNWQGVRFCDEDFVEVAKMARTWMLDDTRNRLAGAFGEEEWREEEWREEEWREEAERNKKELQVAVAEPTASDAPQSENIALESLQPVSAMDIIYLTSDSPHTLTHLSPYTTYIIGGLVDKNRHKGLCYQKATSHNIRTAKLPIGEYMKMQSRQVLTVNQVSEIMLRWLECGDWGEAFVRVVPKRKGGELRHGLKKVGETADAEGEDADEDDEDEAGGEEADDIDAEGPNAKTSDNGLELQGQGDADSEDEDDIEFRV